MPGIDQRFTARWRIPGETAEVFKVLADVAGYPAWWGSVHASARVLVPGDAAGEGRVVELVSGARAPVLLHTHVRIARLAAPLAARLELDGDVRGEGGWRLEADGPYVIVDFDCRVRPRGIGIGLALRALAPLLRAEHRWAMHRGALALQLELRRRRAVTARERAMVPYRAGAAVREAALAAARAQESLLAELSRGPREPVG